MLWPGRADDDIVLHISYGHHSSLKVPTSASFTCRNSRGVESMQVGLGLSLREKDIQGMRESQESKEVYVIINNHYANYWHFIYNYKTS